MASSKKQQKEMIVIAVYHIKRNGATVYRVRSNQPNKNGRVEGTDQEERNGLWYDAHNVTVCNGRISGCTCKGSEFRGKCYHRDGVQALENARYAARKAVKASKHQDKLPTQEVVSPEKEVSKITDISTKGALTRNTGFQLLKVS